MSFEFFFTALLFRAVDLFTTWLVSPDLKRELNPLIRRLGWRYAIYLNLLLAGTCAFMPLPAVDAICFLSFLAASWNIFSWLFV